jgi:hypothetical protein
VFASFIAWPQAFEDCAEEEGAADDKDDDENVLRGIQHADDLIAIQAKRKADLTGVSAMLALRKARPLLRGRGGCALWRCAARVGAEDEERRDGRYDDHRNDDEGPVTGLLSGPVGVAICGFHSIFDAGSEWDAVFFCRFSGHGG